MRSSAARCSTCGYRLSEGSADPHGSKSWLLSTAPAKILGTVHPSKSGVLFLCPIRGSAQEVIMRALILSCVALLGLGSLCCAQDQSGGLRGVFAPPGSTPPPPPRPASQLPRPRTMAPSATVRASRSLGTQPKGRRSQTTSLLRQSRIGPAMGRRQSTAVAPLSTSATIALSKSWTRCVPSARSGDERPLSRKAKADHH